MSNLREELQASRAHHKQQLTEMALLLDEEKQKAALDKQASLEKLRTDMARIQSNLVRSHQQEKDTTHEKVGEAQEGKDGNRDDEVE